ncbi:uncharacterized protein H6S33_008131 [Morchella sextelata]|uniref:uncharacterized protein n=1 Tax=Morchella sextelata TaxID=1174677 RepID=UPI001D03E836|nr:uncharacterized protein H6S33_008131 [Morchella sextelata]KAH0603127.1 hypothetical protein H6S33_008131 [Morchella sextelata]
MSHRSSSTGLPGGPAVRLASISELIAEKNDCELALFHHRMELQDITMTIDRIREQSELLDAAVRRETTTIYTLFCSGQCFRLIDNARAEAFGEIIFEFEMMIKHEQGLIDQKSELGKEKENDLEKRSANDEVRIAEGCPDGAAKE